MTSKITIIDYGMGNLRSVLKKVNRLGYDATISSDPDEICKHSDKLIMPGVGHFANGVKHLHELNLWDALHETVLIKKVPILGICLGMQLMAKFSEEGHVNGLGWFDADVVKFNVKDQVKYKVPHMGWNTVDMKNDSILNKGMSADAMFYFVHSFHFKCNNEIDILHTTNYEYEFVSAVEKDNIFGVQYHPEKSHEFGDQLLDNFLKV